VAGSIEDIGPLISQPVGAEEEASKPGFIIRLEGPGADGNNNEVRPNSNNVNTIEFFILLAHELETWFNNTNNKDIKSFLPWEKNKPPLDYVISMA
jgi:hypothetical protein